MINVNFSNKRRKIQEDNNLQVHFQFWNIPYVKANNDTWILNTRILQSNIVRNTFVNVFFYIPIL